MTHSILLAITTHRTYSVLRSDGSACYACTGCAWTGPNLASADQHVAREATSAKDDNLVGAALDVLNVHRYDYQRSTSRPDDPGWNGCTCGWEGYWCSFHPHLAQELIVAIWQSIDNKLTKIYELVNAADWQNDASTPAQFHRFLSKLDKAIGIDATLDIR